MKFSAALERISPFRILLYLWSGLRWGMPGIIVVCSSFGHVFISDRSLFHKQIMLLPQSTPGSVPDSPSAGIGSRLPSSNQ